MKTFCRIFDYVASVAFLVFVFLCGAFAALHIIEVEKDVLKQVNMEMSKPVTTSIPEWQIWKTEERTAERHIILKARVEKRYQEIKQSRPWYDRWMLDAFYSGEFNIITETK